MDVVKDVASALSDGHPVDDELITKAIMSLIFELSPESQKKLGETITTASMMYNAGLPRAVRKTTLSDYLPK